MTTSSTKEFRHDRRVVPSHSPVASPAVSLLFFKEGSNPLVGLQIMIAGGRESRSGSKSKQAGSQSRNNKSFHDVLLIFWV
jgi:hypothetical protein